MTKISHSSTSTARTETRRSSHWWRRIRAERLLLAFVGAAILALVPSCDEPDPGADIVRVVREAELSHSYRGSKRMVFGSRDSKSRESKSRESKTWEFLVTHFAGRDGEIGPTIMETVGRDSGHSKTRVDWRSRHDYWLADSDRLLANYRIQADGPAEVAGRKGTRYVVRSRYEGRARPSLEVVVDDRSGLLLSYREIDWMGEVAIRVEFTTLVVDPADLPERPVREPCEEKGAETAEPLPPLSFDRLAPRRLPDGFAPKGEGRRSGRSRRGWKAVYSDGLSWFVIRQWKAEDGAGSGVDSGVVKRHVKGSRVWMRMTHEGVAVALYGRLDPSELEQVLSSLARVD